MVLEAQILLYYLRIFSLLIIFFLVYSSYLLFIKKVELKNNNFIIEKNESLKSIIHSNFENLNFIEKYFAEFFLKINSRYLQKIHYGRFIIPDKYNLKQFISIISKPSNYILKITIVEGWDKKELNKLQQFLFEEIKDIEYEEILADTYYFHSYETSDFFLEKLKNKKNQMKQKYKDHELHNKYSFDDLMIIGSLLEKEGKDNLDKKMIFSVIHNRLQKNIKLQIDATTIFAITDGNYDLDRDLKIRDLKTKHPYNTYYIKGLPPGPISYVGKKTMELIYENYKSNYLYYFYNNIEKKHIYSETYNDHKRKLSEYRNKK